MPEKMNPEIRDLWADALESGEYKQGQFVLTRVLDDGSEENCCLGVLCQLAVKAGVIKRLKVEEDHSITYGTGLTNRMNSLPSATVMRWAGLSNNNPIFEVEGRTYASEAVSSLNDDDLNPLTFPEIAKLIRAQL